MYTWNGGHVVISFSSTNLIKIGYVKVTLQQMWRQGRNEVKYNVKWGEEMAADWL